jgi:uncharacterized protein YbjT (DUF2867 family)
LVIGEKAMSKVAIVIGATGLVGRALVEQLLEAPEWQLVRTFGRRCLPFEHPKLQQYEVDFKAIDAWKGEIKGQCLFICIGTTRRQAGSRQALAEVDLSLPCRFAALARANHVDKCVVVSSLMANLHSASHYLRTKGALEQVLGDLAFPFLVLVRPGPLLGKREVPRLSEQIVTLLQPLFQWTYSPLRRWRGIEATRLAKIMCCLGCAELAEAQLVLQGDELFRWEQKI